MISSAFKGNDIPAALPLSACGALLIVLLPLLAIEGPRAGHGVREVDHRRRAVCSG